jgi:ATP-dependent protease ClpP protease subunit
MSEANYKDFTIIDFPKDDSIDDDNLIAYKNNTIYFLCECNRKTIFRLKEVILKILYEKRNDKKKKEINLIVCSWGGHGYSIYSWLKSLNITLNCYIEGYCMSSAGALFLAGNNRYMSMDSVFQIHSHQGAEKDFTDKEGPNRDLYFMSKTKNDIMLRQVYEKETNVPKDELDLMLSYQERILSPEECIKYKIVQDIKNFVG